jgi:5'-deoxynucleotidase YfbR-like HD superfamily hydrolase
MTPYLAAFVRRWHTHPHLSHTVDPIGYHGGRMAILALDLFRNPSRDLLAACVTHDLAESVTGDVPYDSPIKDHGIEDDILDNMGMAYTLDQYDAARLKFLDLLDSYLWARHHAPWLIDRKEWQDQREKILDLASELNVCLVQYQLGG